MINQSQRIIYRSAGKNIPAMPTQTTATGDAAVAEAAVAAIFQPLLIDVLSC
jgi:hypothetical protein